MTFAEALVLHNKTYCVACPCEDTPKCVGSGCEELRNKITEALEEALKREVEKDE